MPRCTSALACVVALLSLPLAACPARAESAVAVPEGFRLIAYATGRTDFARIQADKLTHINYAFGLVNEQAEVYFRTPAASATHLAALTALRTRHPHLRVLLSIGGWGADHFSDAALTAESRARFARSAVAVMQQHQLDGLDLDWEYPGHPGPGIKFRPEDRENFTHLLRDFRTALDAASDAAGRRGAERYLLTIASSDGDYFARTEMSVLHTSLDWINVMTYDRYGAWSETTGHHAGLFASKTAAPGPTTASAVEQHLAAGIPRHKIVVGAAFYGRAWSDVPRSPTGLGQPVGQPLPGDYSYARLAREFIDRNGFVRHWDPEAQAAYLWQPESGTFITFEDPEALRAKAAYVRREQLGGVMYWEQAHDPEGVLLDALHAGLSAVAAGGAATPE